MVEDINYPYDKYLSLALTNNKQVVRYSIIYSIGFETDNIRWIRTGSQS